VRKFVVLALIQLGFLAACGGGGGYGGGGGTPPPPPPTQTIATPGPPNVETLTVDSGPAAATFAGLNTPFISVKVCVPGTMTCQTIDHIEVDTGTSGLRILANVPLNVALPAAKDAGGHPMAECVQFADGTVWGSLALADIQLPVSGEAASNVRVQIIGDPTYPTTPPTDCTGKAENTVAAFGANGILGVGPFIDDCSSGTCPLPPPTGQSFIYYSCPTPSTCADATASAAQQVPNPVTLFGIDSNGVIIELPSVGTAGTTTVSGSLVFGIGTRPNNALGTATVLPEDLNTGFITATYKGTAYAHSFLDSGSNGIFFPDSSLTVCPSNAGFYCPASTMSETATLKGTSATTLAANFSVGNYAMMTSANPNYTAFSNVGGPNPDAMSVDLGLAFFYGHNVFTAIENANTPGGIGPYFAY
jgi:hypothetical protein